MEIFRSIVEDFIKANTGNVFSTGDDGTSSASAIPLEIPPDPNMGDFAFPCFRLSKELKKSPADIALDLEEKFRPDEFIAEAKAIGPYINFFIDQKRLAEAIIDGIQKQKNDYGRSAPLSKEESIMVEYSSPNTNKAQHLGHVRNNLVGMAVSTLLESQGYKVIRTCVMNDKGMGVSKSMLAYKLWGNNAEPDIKPDHYVAKWYVEFAKRAESDPALEEKAHELNRLFEAEDPEVLSQWKKMTDWVYQGYDITYKRLGCTFDKIYYESQLYKHGKDIVNRGLEEGKFKKEDGAIFADLEALKLPNKVLIKSDGTSLYMTQDLYLAQLKHNDFNMDRSIYVVASEQNLHFQQLFAILKLLGHKWAEKCYHLSYGMISLPEGKMKSREGTVVDADALMDDMESLAASEIIKRHDGLTEEEIAERAKIIALGALKFYMLKYEPVKDFLYDPKESLSFEGETGPYVQYVHARICSILRKYGKTLPADMASINFGALKDDKEKRLLVLIGRMPEVVSESAERYKPSLLCTYLIELSQGFNEFYHSCPILTADEETMIARLMLSESVRVAIRNCLLLLGIESPEVM